MERIIRNLLWLGDSNKRGTFSVSWRIACRSKAEGGIDPKSLHLFNKACLIKRLWMLISDNHGLWASWMLENYMQGESFWAASQSTGDSFGWKSILSHGKEVRKYISYRIGYGE